jgi:cell division transport system permease protein
MSMIEIKRYANMAAQWLRHWRQWLPREKAHEAAIVPRHSISGRALVSVIAIMTFLASLTLGAVMLVVAASVQRAVDIARAAPGVTEVLPYSKEESSRLLEPWLGSGAILDSLPVPRLIVVRISPDRPPDFAALRAALAAEVPGASLDDHRSFSDRLRTMADTAIAIGLAIFGLVLAATVLSVSFATRGAVATNRSTVEVLHLIGAKDSYIAGEFQRHFLLLGLKGGAIGGGAAIALFILLSMLGRSVFGQTAGEEVAAMFGGMSLGVGGYFIVLLQILVVAAVTAFASRQVVRTTLRTVG